MTRDCNYEVLKRGFIRLSLIILHFYFGESFVIFLDNGISQNLSAFTSITAKIIHRDFRHVPQALKVMFTVELRRQE